MNDFMDYFPEIGILKATGEHVCFRTTPHVASHNSSTQMEFVDLIKIKYKSGDKIGKIETVKLSDVKSI